MPDLIDLGPLLIIRQWLYFGPPGYAYTEITANFPKKYQLLHKRMLHNITLSVSGNSIDRYLIHTEKNETNTALQVTYLFFVVGNGSFRTKVSDLQNVLQLI